MPVGNSSEASAVCTIMNDDYGCMVKYEMQMVLSIARRPGR